MRRLHAETAPHFKAVEAKRSQRSRAAATIQSQQLPGNKLTEMNDKKKTGMRCDVYGLHSIWGFYYYRLSHRELGINIGDDSST